MAIAQSVKVRNRKTRKKKVDANMSAPSVPGLLGCLHSVSTMLSFEGRACLPLCCGILDGKVLATPIISDRSSM
jgi:hypothetical protein